MVSPSVMHHSGWPWPLDAVQDWFESFWDQIRRWIADAASAVWNLLPAWIRDTLTSLGALLSQAGAAMLAFFKDPIGVLKGAFDQLFIWMRDLLGWWDPTLGRFVGGFFGWVWDVLTPLGQALGAFSTWIWTGLQDIGKWITGTIWGWVDGALRWLTDSFRWLQGEISAAASWTVDQVGRAFDGASQVIGDVLGGFFSQVGEILKGAAEAVFAFFFETLPTWMANAGVFLQERIVQPIWGGLQWAWSWIVEQLTGVFNAVLALFKGQGPITPEKAANLAPMVLGSVAALGLAATGITSVMGIKILGSGLEVGEIGSFVKGLIDPEMFTGAVIGTLLSVALVTPLRQYYQKLFRTTIPQEVDLRQMLWRGGLPEEGYREGLRTMGYGDSYIAGYVELTQLIPMAGDLIRFVVREVIKPADFTVWMARQGYGAVWSEAYWEAHWVLPPLEQVVDAFHRGELSEEELNRYAVLHDFKPEPRPGMTKSDLEVWAATRKTLIPRVDLRRGWELGRLTDAELLEQYRRLGYEEDAELMAEIQKRVALEAEIGKLRDNAKADYGKGYIEEATLRADLAALGLSPTLIEFHVADAVSDRERRRKDLLVDNYGDGYVKDLITEEELRTNLAALIVVPELVELEFTKQYIRKYKRPPPPKAVQLREATLGTLATAFRFDQLTEEAFRAELTRRLYDPAQIDLIVAVEKLKKEKAAGA